MSAYKTDQRRVLHHGREYHFVSYEGVAANPRRGQAAVPPTWFLMRAGKRWFVMPQIPDQASADVDRQLHEWLDLHVGSLPASTPSAPRSAVPGSGEPARRHAVVPPAAERVLPGRRSHTSR